MYIIGFLTSVIVIIYRLYFRVLYGREKRDLIVKQKQIERSVLFEIRVGLWLSRKLHTLYPLKLVDHEKSVLKKIKDIKGDVFVDIGAHVGYYSFLLKDNFKRIIVVEPSLKNISVIIKTARKFMDKIEIAPIAISNTNSTEQLYLSSSSGRHSLVERFGKADLGITKNVLTLTLEDLICVLNIQQIDLVKVDVEGAEWLILEGAKNVMSKIKNWMIELHDSSRLEELNNLLTLYNYSTENIIGIGRELGEMRVIARK